MYLKRLDIQGFKTFASRTVFEFRPGITAIVGPNGSGKSNVADAVRWVLGEQSYAALRCKRTEELLFSGGGRRPPAGLAEVSLTIDNSDRLLPIAFDEVTITRRATRDGDNEYFINRARVRLRDIQAITEPLGGSYTIVNQGLVDAALTLRPEERRRLFEDAAEIGGFEARKAEASRRLRETDGNMQRAADLLGELEPQLRSLKRQAGQARQHRELSVELRELLTQFYATQWRAAQAEAAAAAATVARLGVELEQARAVQTQAAADLRTLREDLRALRDQLGALHRQSSELHRRAETVQRDLAVGAERLAALSRRAEELECSRQDLELRQAEAEGEVAAAQSALVTAEAALSAERARLAEAEAEIVAFEQDRRILARELSVAQDAALKAAIALAEQRSWVEQLAAQRARLAKEQGEFEAALRQADERWHGARRQVETAQHELAAAEAARNEAAESERDARTNLDTLRAERTAADEHLAGACRALADTEARLESLSRLARSYAGAFAGVKAAMQWAERAGRQGFALLSSIIRTPAELETAIEVALGSRLQNIVVESWQDAEDAISELKRSGAGRATFLPLDTIRSTGNREARNVLVSLLGVAADLVDYDPHYAAVVQQLLGRTLVAPDLQTAREELQQLAGGWTIVTLQGEQVQSGGAVTGGAQTKESGTLRRERELRELPRQVQEAQARVEQAEAQRNTLAERIAAITQTLNEAEARSREVIRRYDTQRAALDAATRRTTQAEQERLWQQQRLENAAHDSAGLDVQEATLAAHQAEAETRVTATQEQLTELRARQENETAAGREAQERFAGLRAAVAAAEGQVKAQRVLVQTHRQTIEQLARQQAEINHSANILGAERAQIGAAREQAEAANRALLAEIEALRTRIAPAEAELQAAEQRQAELETAETQATGALLEQEATHNRAALDDQRARDRLESLRERADAEGIALTDDRRPMTDDMPVSKAGDASSVGHRLSSEELQSKIQQLKSRIERLGAVNPLALEEYEEAAERYGFLSSQLDDLRQARATLQELIVELDTAMQSRFSETFRAVAAEFERSFTRLFGGGAGKLHLVRDNAPPVVDATTNGNGLHDEEAPGERHLNGVEIIARPPGKRQQNISLLSGGERTLTAAALLFAILTVNPSPFCILDEVDAALDESNVGRFREALSDLTRTTQFILITHNRGTIEAADSLYGVTMGDDGASKVLSLRVEEFVADA